MKRHETCPEAYCGGGKYSQLDFCSIRWYLDSYVMYMGSVLSWVITD